MHSKEMKTLFMLDGIKNIV